MKLFPCTAFALAIVLLLSGCSRKSSHDVPRDLEADFQSHVKKGETLMNADNDPSDDPTQNHEGLMEAAGEFQQAILVHPRDRRAVLDIGLCYGYIANESPSQDRKALDHYASLYIHSIIAEVSDKDPSKPWALAVLYEDDYYSGDNASARLTAQKICNIEPALRGHYFKGNKLLPPSPIAVHG